MMKIEYLFYAAAIFIVVAALPLPYGYYQLLRIIAFCAFAYASYLSFIKKQIWLAVMLSLMAIVFNPFVKIIFAKEIWVFIDIIAGVGLGVWAWKYSKIQTIVDKV